MSKVPDQHLLLYEISITSNIVFADRMGHLLNPITRENVRCVLDGDETRRLPGKDLDILLWHGGCAD